MESIYIMTVLDDIYSQLLSAYNYLNVTSVAGNTYLDYTIAFGIFLLLIILQYFGLLFIKRFIRLTFKKNQYLENFDLNILDSYGLSQILYVSLYVALQNLTLSLLISQGLLIGLILILIYFGIKVSFGLIDFYASRERQKVDIESRNLVELFTLISKMTIVTLIILWGLSLVGVNITVLITSLGIFSVAIAFGAQNIIADTISALLILIDKPFQIGDFVSIGNDSGTVTKIGTRSTRLQTTTGNMLIIPNRDVYSSRINNFRRMDKRRIIYTVGLSYDSDVKKLKMALPLVKEIVDSHESVQFIRAYYVNFGSYTFDLQLTYDILTGDYETYLRVQQEIFLDILERFTEEDINMPYPIQEVRMAQLRSESV